MLRPTACTVVLCSLFGLGLAQPTVPITYENLNAVLWMQTSVEYKASAVQTYRLAKAALMQGLGDPHWTAALEQDGEFESLPPAVILDLDETVLDNSVFEGRLTDKGEHYTPDGWASWVNERNAVLVPGAMEFLQFAHANGVAPLYITNRACDPSNDKDSTVEVLHKLHLPLDPIRMRLYCDDGRNGDKTERRRKCAERYRILLLFGDQLSDFLQIPDKSANLEGREKLFEAHQSLWGERWFQLSNPTYGSWEAAVSSPDPKKAMEEKLKHLRK
jgi:5'-nucleotidase (lipoprotein e(P4) family)